MSGSLIPNGKQQYLDANGNPLAGGKVYYYIPYTTTAKNTWQDINLSILNTNPIILDSAGECIAWGAGAYRQQVYDVNNNLIWDQYTYGINPAGSNFVSQEEVQTATQGQTAFTLTTITYTPGINSLVVFVNGSKQLVGTNYTETSSAVVTFASGLNAGDVVDFYASLPATAQNLSNAVSVAYNPPFTNAVSTNVQAKLSQYVSVKDFDGSNFSIKLQNAINSLPSTGGVIYADSLNGNQTISQQILLNKPITLYLGSNQFTINSSVTSPAINITQPCHIIGSVSSRFIDSSNTTRGYYGTNIITGSGYTGYVIGVQNVSPYDQFNAGMTQIENMSIDGNAKNASGVLIQGSFNVRLAHLLLNNCSVGVDMVNLNNSQGFSEASNFEDLYINSCQYGIRGVKSAATNSLGHAKWEGIRINITDSNAIGMYFNGAYLYASNVTGVTMWPASTATNSVGIQFESVDIDDRTVFNKVYFESSVSSFVGWKLTGTSTYMPTIIATAVSGSGSLYNIGATAVYWSLGRAYSMNGDFEVGVAGWTYYNTPLASSVAGGQTGKCLKLQTNSGSGGIAVNNLPTKIGYRYRVVVWFKQGSASNSGEIRLGKTVGSSDYANITPSDANWTRYEFTFTATGSFLFINLYSSNGSAASVYSYYDSISVEELGYSLDL
jgi:hypothetical protein